MSYKSKLTSKIAKERLKIIDEQENLDCPMEIILQIKKEISDIICKYFDESPDSFKIKIIHKNE
ncbi:MAG: cell division topological specificity factor MinE [Agathobacter sp.]|nr:cell division topological specificity factor MinE [Agathobacter sp.]